MAQAVPSESSSEAASALHLQGLFHLHGYGYGWPPQDPSLPGAITMRAFGVQRW